MKLQLTSVPAATLIQFFVQLALLERTSLQLLDSLKQTRKAASNRTLRRALDQIIIDLSEGVTLNKAFGKFPEIFNPIVLARLRAGVLSGNLQATFQDISQYLKWREELKSKVRKALLYPMALIGAILLLVGMMMTFMVPQLTGFLGSLDIEISFLTTSLIATASGARAVLPILVPILLVLFIISRLAAQLSPKAALWLDSKRYKTPIIGKIRQQLDQWNFSRLMRMTLGYNKRVQDCIELCATVTRNRYFKQSLKQARQQLLEGEPLTKASIDQHLLDDMALRLMEAGEISGDLPSAFDEIVEYYDIMVNQRLEWITTVIKPAALVFAALMLIWIIAGTMLPLYGSLSSTRF